MEDLRIVRTLGQLNALVSYISDKEIIAFDTETTGVDKGSSIIGYSICAEVGDINVAYYVVTQEWDIKLDKLITLETYQKSSEIMMMLLGKSLVMHNAGFDCAMVKDNFGVDLMPYVHTDTLLAGHLLDENRSNGLKELSTSLFGADSKVEQTEMKASVLANGGMLTKDRYELYKADSELMARYGAKDAILTLKLFYIFAEQLIEQGLDKFFYEDETMPLLRGPTYQMNTTGLRVDPIKLQNLRATLEAECAEAKAFIHSEIKAYVADKYPGTSEKNTFNIGAPQQLSWLLFMKMKNDFLTLTDSGRDVCKALGLKLPYTPPARREFIRICESRKGEVYEEAKYNKKTKKMGRPKKIGDPWAYIKADKAILAQLAKRYKWCAKLLEYNKNEKLLNTYVEGIQNRMVYNIIRPNFLQHGTTSGRYSCKNPNFQNLPRDDKRVKSCIVSREGKSFIGADYSQLEPRVFASFSEDERLLASFKSKQDFYSVIGAEVFNKYDCSLIKDEENSFANKYPGLRQISKVIALATTYGATPPQLSKGLGKSTDETKEIIDSYFRSFPGVKQMMLKAHSAAKRDGQVVNLFGRPRRIPMAKRIQELFGNIEHNKLAYEHRQLLNLAVNHTIQSTAASIVNRSSILFNETITAEGIEDCQIVMQIHDEIVVECRDKDAKQVAEILKVCMENAVYLPGIELKAEPKIGKNLAELK